MHNRCENALILFYLIFICIITKNIYINYSLISQQDHKKTNIEYFEKQLKIKFYLKLYTTLLIYFLQKSLRYRDVRQNIKNCEQ